jgi:hypothetical protein
MVDLFFDHQRSDGMIPYRVMNGPITIGKYFGRSKKYAEPLPTYKLRGFGAEVLDGTTLTIMTLAQLWKKGEAEIDKYVPKVEKALAFLKSKEKNGLLWDGDMCEWNDAVGKRGNLLYSNIIYWNMFRELGMVDIQNEVAKNLRERLWTGKYFADWRDNRRQDYFYAFGNLLAVAWGLTSAKESNSIMKESLTAKIGFTLETNTPKYPRKKVFWFNRLLGIPDYQNQGLLWWQPACAYVAALIKTGNDKEAKKQMDLMSRKIVEDRKVCECYERDGSPVKRLLYQAEQPFAWAAGQYLWAHSLYKKAPG